MPLSAIIGHSHAVGLLRQAVARGRVPQSLLFAGPEGVGKHAVAVALAQAVNCPSPRDGDACGACPACTRIARGQHSDVALVGPGGEASIRIRVLRERVLDVVGYRPFEARRRVYIIEPADLMTLEAQDALLKTLEEPPPAALIVLVTALPDTLAATVQSRCRRLRFGPLLEAEVARVLVERCGVAPGKAPVLAAASGGRVSVALAEDAGDLEADREAGLGLLAAAAGARGVGARLKAATALVQHKSKRRDREALAERLAVVAGLVRDLAAIGSGSDAALASPDLADTLGGLARAWPPDRAARAADALARARAALARHASPKIVADWVALEL